MTIRVDLGNVLYLCPPYWVNFVNQLEDKYSSNPAPETGYTRDDGFPIEFLNNELSPYFCTFNGQDNKFWLDFQSESDYAAFILRYGD